MFNNAPKYKLIPYILAGLLFLLGMALINVNTVVEAQDNLPLIVGVSILIVGVVRLIYGLVLIKKEKDSLYNIVYGAIDLIFGIVFLVYIHDKIIFMVVLSIYILVEASLDCYAAISRSYPEIPWLGALIIGLVKFAFGILIMFKPFGGFNLWVVFAGIYFMLQCASWVFLTTKLKNAATDKQE